MNSKVLMIAVIAGIFAIAGCSKKSPTGASEEAMIAEYVAISPYTSGDGFGGTNDGSSTPRGFSESGPDTSFLPPVRFARHITGNKRTIKVDSISGNRRKAWVTVYHDLTGWFYVNSDPGNPWRIYIRPLSDRAQRKVYLEKNDYGVWMVRKITPVDWSTVNSSYPISILKVSADATPSGVHYEYTRWDTLVTKESLPTFLPGDEVTVRVSVSVQSDSSWVFLHRWARPYPYWYHIREPFYKTSTNEFVRTWKISSDSVSATPVIRHAAVDAIGWKALFGDSTTQYNAHAWGLLYVVKNPTDPYPE